MHGGLAEDISDFRKLLKSQINNIKSLKRRLPLLIGPDTKSHNTDTPFNKNIFLVHGHKDNFKLEVARTLEQLKLNPIILDEKPNEGQTIIEKFEKHASISSLAVVLLTADDEIKTSSKSEIKWRARQNVILELGYFLAKLGRQRVIALYEENVEIPSDYSGVLYIPFRSDWKLKLAGEIKNLGLEIDLNLLHNLQ
ncbi:MAG: nucleotide-binding protein [Legionella sp.]|nr:MAG: nucleotide-binding protein [Legionella sp.]